MIYGRTKGGCAVHFAASLLVLMPAAVCFEEAAGITHCLFSISSALDFYPNTNHAQQRLANDLIHQHSEKFASIPSESLFRATTTKATMASIWEMASRISMPEEIRVIHHGNTFASMRRVLRLPECRVVFAFCIWVLLLFLAACHYKRFTLTPFFRMVNRNFA
ncbi:hypothetical protein CCMA1212_004091 [Trichoderma ghanense]|uniref:Uncharacterized protein n=1 Tax=Trichoderma ghanense TaxID=65468 RepID=A0ABY2H7A5_9HYPO